MASNPMQQFSVHKIGPEIKIAGIDLSFTNASLFMVISASIIITHHALTMSRMHRLYGVTMAEQGVSQLVAVDLQKAEGLVA